jgi:apolipoprotein D and lipocalin family protein
MYAGRWYEIARIAEGKERRCAFPTNDFSGHDGVGYHVVQTCHEVSADGPAHTNEASVTILPNTGNAKIKLGFLGGMFHQEFWILDHAPDDNAWALMATPGGRYLWLLSRQPTLTPEEHAAAVARITALGYNAAHLKPSR